MKAENQKRNELKDAIKETFGYLGSELGSIFINSNFTAVLIDLHKEMLSSTHISYLEEIGLKFFCVRFENDTLTIHADIQKCWRL